MTAADAPSPHASPPSPLDDLTSAAEYQTSRQKTFPSREALRWYIRQHRTKLQEAGALLYIRGRMCIESRAFDDVVIRQGREAAKRIGGQA